MGSVTFTRVFSSGPLYGGCGPKGVTCYGNRKMLAVFEETGFGPAGAPQRLIYSADDGQSWVEGEPYYSQYNIWWYRALSPVTDRILVGNAGPYNGVLGADATIALSEDGAVNWASAYPDQFDPSGSDYWFTDWLEQCTGPRVLAAGWFRQGSASYNLLVSDDGGRTFTPDILQAGEADPPHLSCLAHCGDQIVFATSLDPVYDVNGYIAGRPLWRSLDNGQTWTRQQLFSTHYPTTEAYGGLTYVAYLGGTKMLVLGSGCTDAGAYVPLVWLSDDLGDSWQELSRLIVDGGAWSTDLSDWNFPQWAASWGDGQYLLIGIFRQSGSGECPAAIFSETGGTTWQAAIIPSAEPDQTEVEVGWGFVGKGDDGSLSATLYRLTTDDLPASYPAMSITLGAVSGQGIALQASGDLFPDPETAMQQTIRTVGGAEFTVVGWLDAANVFVNIVTAPETVGPFVSGDWYLAQDNRNHWDIYHAVASWDMGAGPCVGSAPPPPPPVVPPEYHWASPPERDTYHPCPQECGLSYP